MKNVLSFIAISCLGLACAAGGESTGALSFGAMADDDGCPGASGCPKKAVAGPESSGHCATYDKGGRCLVATPEERAAREAYFTSVDPYPKADGSPNKAYRGEPAGVVVGTNDLKDTNCFPPGTGIPFNAGYTVRYRARNGAVCTGLHATVDGRVAVPGACKAPPGTSLGVAEFGYDDATCNTGILSADYQLFNVSSEVQDPVTGWFMAVLTVAPSTFGWQTAKFGTSFSPQVNTVDEVLSVSHKPGDFSQADDNCRITSAFVSTPAGLVAKTDCDTIDPDGLGANVVLDFNGFPNPGPTTPGILPGRLACLYYGPDGLGQNNCLHPSALFAPGKLFGPFMTPGNFVQ